MRGEGVTGVSERGGCDKGECYKYRKVSVTESVTVALRVRMRGKGVSACGVVAAECGPRMLRE